MSSLIPEDLVAQLESSLSQADEAQRAMMEERVILTDYYDNPTGSGSKTETHLWRNIESGMVHRAFSVFLFSQEGKLLLQQRAATKVTFPLIWANTCCSHPLNVVSETGMVDACGVKAAAVRKLGQELGIPPEDVPLDSFTWLTKVHYAGASVPKGGSPGKEGEAPLWGEHEIDWILVCSPPTPPRIQPNPNEVERVRAFTQQELREWVARGGDEEEEEEEVEEVEEEGKKDGEEEVLEVGAGSGTSSGSRNSGRADNNSSSSNSSGSSGSGSGSGRRRVAKGATLVSPWFAVMESSGLLYKWWDAVLEKRLEGVMERDVIYRQQDLEAMAKGRAPGSVVPPTALSACRDRTHQLGVMGPKAIAT